jgi:DeoR family fructose operon transcriptional repressor
MEAIAELARASAVYFYKGRWHMLAEQRQTQILQLLESRGSITLTELVSLLNASESTIRRDLQELDRQNLLVRVFGGAMSVNSKAGLREENVSERQTVNIKEKQRIGRYAAALIQPNDFVYIDAGTTTGAMIPFITEQSAVYVTNAVAHGLELVRRGFRVNLIGGEIRPSTEAIVGNDACEALHSFNFTKCFMGTNGANPNGGLTTPDVNEAAIKRRALTQSRDRYVLCTSEKFRIISPVCFFSFADATIITDHCPSSWYEQQPNIIVVEE